MKNNYFADTVFFCVVLINKLKMSVTTDLNKLKKRVNKLEKKCKTTKPKGKKLLKKKTTTLKKKTQKKINTKKKLTTKKKRCFSLRAFGWSSKANQSVRQAAIDAAIAHVNKKKKNGVEQVYKFLFKMSNLHNNKPAGPKFKADLKYVKSLR